jgi:hypothetical protein
MKANKKFENAQRIKQGLIDTWELCRKAAAAVNA